MPIILLRPTCTTTSVRCVSFGENSPMSRLAWTFAARICDKSRNRILIPAHIHAKEPLFSNSAVIADWLQWTRAQITLFWATVIHFMSKFFTAINYQDDSLHLEWSLRHCSPFWLKRSLNIQQLAKSQLISGQPVGIYVSEMCSHTNECAM